MLEEVLMDAISWLAMYLEKHGGIFFLESIFE